MKKKTWIISALIVLSLFGCNHTNNGTLNTSNLKKVEQKGNMTKEQLKTIPERYEASSLEEGLDALPFKIKIPNDIPFNAMPFRISTIDDIEHDGKKLRVDFSTFSKEKDEMIILTITVHNFEVEYSGTSEEVKLAGGVIGHYYGNSLTFEKNGIYYEIGYNNKNISPEQHKKDIIKIANQML
ncbi:hypothetical protein [Bacillus sp. AFS017336]|uniref:hypothetical protein n=1 Tax=Bacillus sp. AFS017336 TaxID=2033489 RepID=UPI000BF04604|nr:hypothetical protein [Bacillus sp. AFS017336]PEL13718.1 hypothetical protein CN601_03120 [Bacillus sp. AFS017336]